MNIYVINTKTNKVVRERSSFKEFISDREILDAFRDEFSAVREYWGGFSGAPTVENCTAKEFADIWNMRTEGWPSPKGVIPKYELIVGDEEFKESGYLK